MEPRLESVLILGSTNNSGLQDQHCSPAHPWDKICLACLMHGPTMITNDFETQFYALMPGPHQVSAEFGQFQRLNSENGRLMADYAYGIQVWKPLSTYSYKRAVWSNQLELCIYTQPHHYSCELPWQQWELRWGLGWGAFQWCYSAGCAVSEECQPAAVCKGLKEGFLITHYSQGTGPAGLLPHSQAVVPLSADCPPTARTAKLRLPSIHIAS